MNALDHGGLIGNGDDEVLVLRKLVGMGMRGGVEVRGSLRVRGEVEGGGRLGLWLLGYWLFM